MPSRGERRRSKLRALAAASSLLGALTMGVALGLFDPASEGAARRASHSTTRSAAAAAAGGGGDGPVVAKEAVRRTDDSPSSRQQQEEKTSEPDNKDEEREQERLRLLRAPPSEQILAMSQSSDKARIVDPSDPLRNCVLRPAAMARSDLSTPVFAASYPGSGSRMLRHLIEALTGVATGDEWARISRRTVAIKTHYPHGHGTQLDFDWADEVDSAILLLRNPRDAIPSLGNHLYERKHGMTDHSTRAPLEEWVEWRNAQFTKQLESWKDMVVYWAERVPSDRRLVLTYEGLTGTQGHDSELTGGSASTQKLAAFLSRSVEGLTVVPQNEMQCVWYKVVKYDAAAERDEEGRVDFHSKRVDRPEGPAPRPYASWMLERMVDAFREIREKFPDDADLVAVMKSYEAQVGRNLSLHEQAKVAREKAQAQQA